MKEAFLSEWNFPNVLRLLHQSPVGDGAAGTTSKGTGPAKAVEIAAMDAAVVSFNVWFIVL